MFYSDNDSFFSSFRLSTVAIRILFRWLVSVGAVTFLPREIYFSSWEIIFRRSVLDIGTAISHAFT